MLLDRLSTFLFDRGLPYVHGCAWNRDCRAEGAPPRVYFHNMGKLSIYIDLPGWWQSVDPHSPEGQPLIRRHWNQLGVGFLPKRRQ